MSEQTKVDLEDVLRHFREINAAQAQEIAILKATIDAINAKNEEVNGSNL
jgi:hypothetical protein